jgi:hypothetical protein
MAKRQPSGHSGSRSARRAALIILLLLAAPRGAPATLRLDELGLGRLEASGNVQTQNIIRHPDPEHLLFVQQRNSFRLRLDWDLMGEGGPLGRVRPPGIRGVKAFFLYRFVYDSIYDSTPNFAPEFDLRGTNLKQLYATADVPQRFRTLDGLPEGERDAYKFENEVREAYVDVKLRRIPLSLRIGRQQIVWGETDNFRMLDRVNTLDLSWHLAFEVPPPAFGWDELRQPFFMLKGLYDLGAVGPLTHTFFEVYWNPGDWHPAKQAFLPRPWGLQIYDPLTNPVDGAFNFAPCTTSEVATNPRTGFGRCTRLMNGTRLFEQGDYDQFDPLSNSQVGARFHALSPQGIEFTLNYLWQRWGGDDGTNYAPIQALPIFNRANPQADPNAARSDALIRDGILPAEYITPYIHTAGISANYADDEHTQVVYRLETILDFGIPFFDRGKRTVLDDLLPGVTQKNMWKGMLAADRSVWIRWLNRKSTFLLTTQFFWHHLINNPDCPDAIGPNFGRNGNSCLTGGLDLPSVARTKADSFRDKIRDWESIITFGTLTFYRGGSIIPVAGFALDPVNHWNGLGFLSVDYVITPSVIVNLAQRYFLNLAGEGPTRPIFSTWGLGGINRTRSETALRLTFQF